MPSTYNGVGTWYYGKKNHSTRNTTCEFCRKVGNLESYDTRLYFVVLFIPVIPLGRKRIIDKCPRCSRHMVAKADEYEQARQLQTSEGLERFRREGSPDSALDAHARFLAFREFEQAEELRRTAAERFHDDAPMLAGFGGQLMQAALYAESKDFFDRALEQREDLPEARIGVARFKMAAGELDEARELLDFLEVPGAGERYSMGPLDQLASNYQEAGRHQDALDLSAQVLRELPEVGQQHKFREFVRKSEKALRLKESILPPMGHSLRGLFQKENSPYPVWLRRSVAAAAVLLLVSAGLVFSNEYIRTHRSIYVLNTTGKPLTVEVDNEPPQAFPSTGKLTIAEGKHHLKLTGAVKEDLDVDLNSGYVERWTSKPAWILNPGASAAIDETRIVYSEVATPPQHRLIVGQSFVSFPHVDYLYESPPTTIKVKRNAKPVEKIYVHGVEGDDFEIFLHAFQTDKPGAFRFAEGLLRRHPDRDNFLKYYTALSMMENHGNAEAFLEEQLDHRPVLLQWHRGYQTLVEAKGRNDELIAQYDRYLNSDPNNGALLYLRGRVELDWEKQREYDRKSIEADPNLPWPWMSLGMRAMAEANWQEALRCLRKSQELKIDPDQINESLHTVRLASGEAKALVEDYRRQLMIRPAQFNVRTWLSEAMAVAGQGGQIDGSINEWEMRSPYPDQPDMIDSARVLGYYLAGDFEKCDETCKGKPSLRASTIRAQALLALGKPAEVASESMYESSLNDPWTILAVSLGLSNEGHADEAKAWFDRGCKALENRFLQERLAVKVLKQEEAPSAESVMHLMTSPEEKALIFCLLGTRFPDRKAEYHQGAARFNVRRTPPAHLIRRIVDPNNSATKP